MWLMVVLFGAYMLLYGTAFLIQWWLYRQDGVKGRFLMFLMMIGFYVVGGIFLLSPSLTMDDMLILFGIYCLMPVSYTHLDVYKRQHPMMSCAAS